MIKCVIFDSDGTLVDSEPLGHKCMEKQLAKYGILESTARMAEDFRGWKLGDILDKLSEEHQGFDLPEGFIPEYRAELDIMFEAELKAMSGVAQAIEKIGLPICVASSGPIAKIKTALRVTGLAKYFGDRLFSAYEIGSWKPDPTLFLFAAKEMGFTPEGCLVIEDSAVGVQAALAAGMNVIHYNPEGITIPFDLKSIAHFDELVLDTFKL